MSLTCSPFLVRVVTMAPNTPTAHRCHMLLTPDPKPNAILTQVPQTLGVPCSASCMDYVCSPRECTSRSLSLSQTHCLHAEPILWISRKNLTLFSSPKYAILPLGLSFIFLFLKNILLPKSLGRAMHMWSREGPAAKGDSSDWQGATPVSRPSFCVRRLKV